MGFTSMFYGSLMWTVFPYSHSQMASGTKVLIRSIEFVLIHFVSYSTDDNLLDSKQWMKNSHSRTLMSVKPHLN